MGPKVIFKKWSKASVAMCMLLLSVSFQSPPQSPSTDASALTFEEIEKYVQKVNLLKEKKQLTRYSYPDMTTWGSVSGYWQKEGIVLAESQYNAEAGYTKMIVYYSKDEVLRIISERHAANWMEYERDHGDEEFDISKLTYTDELHEFTFGKELTVRKLEAAAMVPAEVDKGRAEELKASALQMAEFLYENGVK